MNFGKSGAGYGKLGASTKTTSGPTPGPGGAGSPIGLLLVLTQAS